MDYEEMLELSEDPNMDPEVLARLYHEMDPMDMYHTKLYLASNPNTPLEILFEIGISSLSCWPNLLNIFNNVIENPSSPDYMEKYLNAKNYMRRHPYYANSLFFRPKTL